MLAPHQICSLTTALTGFIILVSISIILLFVSAFLYPAPAEKIVDPDGKNAVAQRPASRSKPAPLTEQQLQGKTLFTTNCGQCHALTDQVVLGPGLLGVTKRAPSEEWLLNWIRNSQGVVASGEPYAVAIYNKFNKIAMPSFSNLTDANIRAILSYVDANSANSANTLDGGGDQ